MSWKQLLAEGRVRTHQASKKELNELRALIARDLEGAGIQELSYDRRFATAYNAALLDGKNGLSPTVVRERGCCSVFRVVSRIT